MHSGRLLLVVAGAITLAVPIAACTNDSPAAPATPKASVCNYVVSPMSASVGNIGTFLLAVNAVGDSTCPWTASTTDAWIHFVGANSGQGTGVVRFTVDSQWPDSRHGTVTVIWT